MPTKKKTDEDPQPAPPVADTAAAEGPKYKPEAPPKWALYQKAQGSYTIAGIPFPPFKAVRTPAALAERIDGSVDPAVLRVYGDEEKAQAAAKAIKAKLAPSTGADD